MGMPETPVGRDRVDAPFFAPISADAVVAPLYVRLEGGMRPRARPCRFVQTACG